MEEILHQLIMYVVYPIIYKIYVSQVVQDFFHQQYESIILDMETNQTFEDFKCLCVCVCCFFPVGHVFFKFPVYKFERRGCMNTKDPI